MGWPTKLLWIVLPFPESERTSRRALIALLAIYGLIAFVFLMLWLFPHN
jgi:hypothetical protein